MASKASAVAGACGGANDIVARLGLRGRQIVARHELRKGHGAAPARPIQQALELLLKPGQPCGSPRATTLAQNDTHNVRLARCHVIATVSKLSLGATTVGRQVSRGGAKVCSGCTAARVAVQRAQDCPPEATVIMQ